MYFEEIKKRIPEYTYISFFERRSKYASVIPVLNEGQRFLDQLDKMKDKNIFNISDIFICDGGSSDSSSNSEIIKNYGCKGLITNTSNVKGHGTQLKQGYYEALKEGYDGIITFDGNNKDNIEDTLKVFIQKFDEGYDVIQATRFSMGGKGINTPLSRYLAIKFIASPLVSLCSGYYYTDPTNGYKAFSRRYMMDNRIDWFREEYYQYEYGYFPLVHAKKLGYKITQVPTIRKYPIGEVPSKIKGFSSNLKLLRQMLNSLFNKPK